MSINLECSLHIRLTYQKDGVKMISSAFSKLLYDLQAILKRIKSNCSTQRNASIARAKFFSKKMG
jgi:hypothetical protein